MEVLVSLSIFGLVAVSQSLIQSEILSRHRLQREVEETIDVLYIAQNRAMGGVLGVPHGVTFEQNKLIIFKGETHEEGEGEVYTLDEHTIVTGEVTVFGYLTGESPMREITVANGFKTKTITIDAGRIESD